MDAVIEKKFNIRSRNPASDNEIVNILSDKQSKDFMDLRDRAAYVYVTGTFPTHLRTMMTSLLRKVTRYSRVPVSLDRRSGSISLTPSVVDELQLEKHPMVARVKDFLNYGYRIERTADIKARRPYSRVHLLHPLTSERLTVQVDGSVREGW